jgi:hypothetical protein
MFINQLDLPLEASPHSKTYTHVHYADVVCQVYLRAMVSYSGTPRTEISSTESTKLLLVNSQTLPPALTYRCCTLHFALQTPWITSFTPSFQVVRQLQDDYDTFSSKRDSNSMSAENVLCIVRIQRWYRAFALHKVTCNKLLVILIDGSYS